MGWISAAFGIGRGLYQAYKVWFLIVPLAAMVAGMYLYYRQAETNKARLAVMTHDLQKAADRSLANQAAVRACEAANAANAAEAARLKERVTQAEIRAAGANVAADKDVETINREETTFRAANLSCPAITPDFRKWLRGNS